MLDRPAKSDAFNKGKRELEIVFFDAGSGHRSAANALAESIGASYANWNVRLVNLQTLLRSTDPLYKVTGVRSETVYNTAIRRGWTKGSKQLLRTIQKGIRLNTAPMKTVLRRYFRTSEADLVVSVVPNFNRVLFEALKLARPLVPYVTIMTDIADSPPNFWMENQDQFIICGSRKAVLQAHMTGFYRPERILETSGMILRPSFYREADDLDITRENLGLDTVKPTAIIMFGGNGSTHSAAIAANLRAMGVQSIVMCGKSTGLLDRLKGIPGCRPVGFTDKVASYMRAADFFVGKPGPGSMSEALHMGLPVIVENNARTLIQERYNIVWAEEKEVGVSLRNFSDIGLAVRFFLRDHRLEHYRRNALNLNNRAVFEIPAMLEGLMQSQCWGEDSQESFAHFQADTGPMSIRPKRLASGGTFQDPSTARQRA